MVVLNITEIDPQLMDNYITQWMGNVIRTYAQDHEANVADGEAMMRIGENYLGDVARAA